MARISVTVYFTKLTRLWDELDCLRIFLICICDFAKIINELENVEKVIQFLMGLIDSYGLVKDQILIMESLHNVNRAYSMVLSVEK
uniref:Uncharacterized protein n=1 Tax=Manihot esculenta TaxID=3983 RepID=A0A2C9U2Y0_MANES